MRSVDVPENMMRAALSLHTELTTTAHKIVQSKHTREHEVPNSQVVGDCPGTHMLFSLAISEYSRILPGSCGTDVDMVASSL